MTDLQQLFDAHTAALAAWDALAGEDWDQRMDEANNTLTVTRRAILDHRPATIEEVASKAAYMASTKSFVIWDDLDPVDLIMALAPTCSLEVCHV